MHRGGAAPIDCDQLWVADFSYVWTLVGFVYVAFVVDVFSRRALGWWVAPSMHTRLVIDAFRHALQPVPVVNLTRPQDRLIHHSDADS